MFEELKSKVKAPKIGDVLSAIGLYALFPANFIFGVGDRILKPKIDPDEKAWKKLLKDNPVARIFTAFVLVMGVNQGIQQVGGLTFDRADDYLREAGYSEDIIREFEDENIRVRPRSTYGAIHTAHDLPPLMSLFSNITAHRMDNDALATPNTGLGALLNTNKWLKMAKPYLRDYLARFVTAPNENATSIDIISQFGEVPVELLSGLDIDDQQLRQAMTLYVLRLMDAEKDLGEFESEHAEALLYAFNAVSAMHNDPAFARLALYVSAIDFDDDPRAHYEALMIDAHFAGQPQPRQREAEAAIRELTRYFPAEHNPFDDDLPEKLSIFQNILQEHGDTLSPLARRRAELYIEGATFFAPDAFENEAATVAISSPKNQRQKYEL